MWQPHEFSNGSAGSSVQCLDCGNQWFAAYRPHFDPSAPWFVHDPRGVEVARTGLISRWLPDVSMGRWPHGDGWEWWVDGLGLTLVIVGHHHSRGQVLELSDETWAAVRTLFALDGENPRDPFRLPLDCALMIMGALRT